MKTDPSRATSFVSASVPTLGYAIFDATRAWTIVCIALGLIIGIIASPLTMMIAIGLTIAAYLLITYAGRRWPQYVDHVAVALIIVFTIVDLLFASLFSAMQPSDFGVYFRCGWAPHMFEILPAACTSKYIDIGNVFFKRSFFYTAPWHFLFGTNYFALKLFNAALQSIFLIALWAAIRRAFGSLAAVAAVFLAGCSLERIYAISLATSDNLALPMIALSFLMVEWLRPSARLRVGVIVVLLICLEVADATRTVGQLLFLGVLGGFVATYWRNPKRAFALAAILVVGNIVVRLIAARLYGPSSGGSTADLLLSTMDISGHHGFVNLFAWMEHYWPQLPKEDQHLVALVRFAQDLATSWRAIPGMIIDKAGLLFEGDGYASFATLDFSTNLDTQPIQSAQPSATLLMSADGFRALAAPLSLLSLVGIVRLKPSLLGVTMLFFVVVFLVTILGFFAVQPRYALVLLPALAGLAGGAFADRELVSSIDLVQPARLLAGAFWSTGIAASAIFLVVLFTQVPLRGLQTVADGRPGCRESKALLGPGDIRRSITFPPGATCINLALQNPTNAKRVLFAFSDGHFPYRFEPAPPDELSVRLTPAPGESSVFPLIEHHVRWIDMPLAPGRDNLPLQLTVSRTGDLSDAGEAVISAMIFR